MGETMTKITLNDTDMLHRGLNNLSDDVDALTKRVVRLESKLQKIQQILKEIMADNVLKD